MLHETVDILTILESRSSARGLVPCGKYEDRGRWYPRPPVMAPACLACCNTTALAALSWMKHRLSSEGQPKTSMITWKALVGQ